MMDKPKLILHKSHAERLLETGLIEEDDYILIQKMPKD